MIFYHPSFETNSDYSSIRKNGMWYQSWQSGYFDIIANGYPKPKSNDIILAELFSPDIEDFLHGGDGNVPFIISEKTKYIFDSYCLTGFKYLPVEISKIASNNRRSNKPDKGEPEDNILKRTNKIKEIIKPKLYGVKIISLIEVIPDYNTGKAPNGYVSPFKINEKFNKYTDLWIPSLNNVSFTAWAFCSDKFKKTVETNNLTNISFIPFNKFMNEFRNTIIIKI